MKRFEVSKLDCDELGAIPICQYCGAANSKIIYIKSKINRGALGSNDYAYQHSWICDKCAKELSTELFDFILKKEGLCYFDLENVYGILMKEANVNGHEYDLHLGDEIKFTPYDVVIILKKYLLNKKQDNKHKPNDPCK